MAVDYGSPPEKSPLNKFFNSPNVKHYKVDALFILTAVLIGKVLILRAIRHRKPWGVVTFLLMVAGYLGNPAITYVIGLMSDDAANVSDITVLWAVFLVVLDGTVDNTASRSLEENEATRKRFLWDRMLPSLWLLFLLFVIISPDVIWMPSLLLWVLYLLKLREKKMALIYACRSRVGLYRVTTAVVEYMRGESTSTTTTTTTTIQDYQYLVGVKEALNQVVSPVYPPLHKDNLHPDKLATIDKIWQCDGKLLGADDTDGHLKDTCLSFALFWRLLPRFADYNPPKESSDKAWKFVRDVFLANDDDEEKNINYKRVYRVVELELQYLRDYFYTNYFCIYRSGAQFLLVRVVFVAIYLLVSFTTLKTINMRERKDESSHWYDVSHLQLLITKIVIYTICVVELAHIVNMTTSRWNKVKWICSYVQNEWWKTRRGKVKEWLLFNLCYQPFFKPCVRPWHRQLRQYSLLDSYGHTPLKLRFKWVLEGYMELPIIGQKEIAPTSLSNHVMHRVLVSLRTNGPKLRNGVESLRQYDAYNKLSWACNSNETTRIILVWHIATSKCEKDRKKVSCCCIPLSCCGSCPKIENPNFRVATSLSKYCAYLVAFVPKLLPDHVYMTQWIFEQAVSQARKELKPKCCSMFNKLIKLITKATSCCLENNSSEKTASCLEQGVSPSLEQGENMMKMGLILAEQIKGLGDENLWWEVLADFWAELILFLAPSDDANEHAKHLVTGGEFITHLWALLTHAGIVDRDDDHLGDN